MKKKVCLILFTLLVFSLNYITVFASDKANVMVSPVLNKVPLSESGRKQARINANNETNAVVSPALRKTPLSEYSKDQPINKSTYTYNDPSNYPLIEKGGYVDYLTDSWYTYHYVYFNSVEQASTASNLNLIIKIISDDYYYKDMFYTAEIFKNNNNELSYYGGYEFSIDETSNNWTLTATAAKANLSDQEYIYIRLGVEESYASNYYNDTILFKVSNPYYVPPVDYSQLNSFVTRFYQLCLGRDPDQSGLTYYVDRLANRTMTGAAISNNFIFSQEFVNKNVTDKEFVDIMYKAFFDRDGDSGGKAYWMDKLANGNSRLYVLSCFVNSTEFSSICNNYAIDRGSIQLSKPADLYPNVTGFVYRFYDRCMGRKPDNSGLNYWVNNLATKKSSATDLAYGFLVSPEFTGRKLSNTDYMNVMYKVFFNRDSDATGMNYWVNNLNTGNSRIQVFKGFANSKEFSAICSDYGINVK